MSQDQQNMQQEQLPQSMSVEQGIEYLVAGQLDGPADELAQQMVDDVVKAVQLSAQAEQEFGAEVPNQGLFASGVEGEDTEDAEDAKGPKDPEDEAGSADGANANIDASTASGCADDADFADAADLVEAPDEPKREVDTISDGPLVGLGVDIVEIARVEQILKRTPHFKERVYTQMERDYAESKPNSAIHYALFFAAKEAVLKALGTGFTGMGINDVQVAHNMRGKPVAVLSGNAKKVADEQGIAEVYLSLSYTHTTGVASAVAARKENIPAKKIQEDEQQKLAQQFRNMRALLDQIDTKLTEIENSQEG